MKRLLISICLFLTMPLSLQAAQYEIDIHGMTCAFCVDGLERNLRKRLDLVEVQTSLKKKKVRIETRGESVDFELIRQTVIDAGFTPVRVERIDDEK